MISNKSKNFFDDLTRIYNFPRIDENFEFYKQVLDKIPEKPFLLFNYRNIRLSITVEYIFRTCKHHHFIHIVIMLNKVKAMMLDSISIKKMIQYRRNQSSINLCLKTVKKKFVKL
ncbi:hypothetical protein EDEG_02645 [Edhazardia aedis USNM 41457]|uniref:Uncharacterized protein n=1 Tax=Edhazardia aedis (strain USNM 41457) TaxID=1003232 RepID=J9D5C8_EDHAE|nr:hypothetical protein EDEG_02645 [Edhazardia aedis USNM 41457]|eukprot:EJW03001.1 hypothetical protein EDEG_02645 [Edhazardia aedis USNM 41457]